MENMFAEATGFIREYWKLIKRERIPRLLLFVTIFVLASSTLVYILERGRPETQFDSLWDAVWWSFVTIGTVGYGDIVPKTTGGRVVGIISIFFGVGLLSLFTATIASIFVERRIREGKGLENLRLELQRGKGSQEPARSRK
jgi:voltage-gated potassium channel